MLFYTYALLISGGVKGSRLDAVVDWLSDDDAPLILFDEAHKCKNVQGGAGKGKPSKTALTAVALQQRLPSARVVYASATGASTPDDLAYMIRLGAFGMGSSEEMLGTLKRAGLGSLELFSMGLKACGAYACRTLSYSGAEFELAEVPLSPAMRLQYDNCTMFWALLARVFREVSDGSGLQGKAAYRWAGFWAAHQRCFRQLILAAKVGARPPAPAAPWLAGADLTPRPRCQLLRAWPWRRSSSRRWLW